MVRTFTFARTKRTDPTIAKNEPKQRVERPGALEELDQRSRFKRPTEVLKKLDIGLLAKMEEMKALPSTHTNDEIGSFFYDEMEFFSSTESSSEFRELYLSIVDKSQTLPIILLNKKEILSKVLSKYDDKYFQPICTRLLIALIRDCGKEIYQEYLDQVIPEVSRTVTIQNIDAIQNAYKVFASSLRFLIKPILADPESFIKPFLTQLIKKNNVSIRRFTAESVSYVITRIRSKQQLESVLKMIISSQYEVVTQKLKDDFDINLLANVIKGDHGSISDTGAMAIEFFSHLLSIKNSDYIRKFINIFIEKEYKHFKSRHHTEESKPSESKMIYDNKMFLDEFLTQIFQLKQNNRNVCSNILAIISELLLFANGNRYSDKINELAETITARMMEETSSAVPDEVIILAAKLIYVKKQGAKMLDSLREIDLTADHYDVFLENLFMKNTFTRTEIRTKFKKNIIDLNPEIRAPEDLPEELAGSLILFLMKGLYLLIGNEAKQIDAEVGTSIFLMAYCLQVTIPRGTKLRLEQDCMNEILNVVQGVKKASFIARLGGVKLLEITNNWESTEGVTAGLLNNTGLHDTPSKTWKSYKGPKAAQEVMNVDQMYSPAYRNEHSILTMNSPIQTPEEREVFLRCSILQVILKSTLISKQSTLQTVANLVFDMLADLQDNHTIVIQTLELLQQTVNSLMQRKNSKIKEGKFEFVDKDPGLFVLPSANIKQRVLCYLWSDVPAARLAALSLLLEKDSTLKPVLDTLDSTEVVYENERLLYLTASDLTTSLYYDKFTEWEEVVCFHFLVGFVSFRINTLQMPLSAASAILLRKHNEKLLATFANNLMIWSCFVDNENAMQAEEEGSPEITQIEPIFDALVRSKADPVEENIKRFRVVDWLENILGYYGQPWETLDKYRSASRGNKGSKKEQRESTPLETFEETVMGPSSDQNEALSSKSLERLRIVYQVFRKILEVEIMPFILPSLSLAFSTHPSRQEHLLSNGSQPAISSIVNSITATLETERDDQVARRRRGHAIERVKKFLKAMRSSRVLSDMGEDEKKHLTSYLLELIKFPGEEVQVQALGVIFRLCKDNMIYRQNSKLIMGLTTRDSFKENLSKLIEVIKSQTMIERRQLIPLMNAVLYRRLVDRTAFHNRQRFISQRDFIFDTACAYYNEEEIWNMLLTIFLSHGVPVVDSVPKPFYSSRISLTKIVSLLDMMESLIKRLGSGMERKHIMDVMFMFSDCIKTTSQARDHLKAEYERIQTIVKSSSNPSHRELLADDDDEEEEVQDKQDEEENNEEKDKEEQEDDEDHQHDEEKDEQDEDHQHEDEEPQQHEQEQVVLTAREKAVLLAHKHFKTIRISAFRRIIQVQALFIEFDYSAFYAEFLPTIQSSISRLSSMILNKIPPPLRLLFLWSECELYKPYFKIYPFTFKALISVILNVNATSNCLIEVFDSFEKLKSFNLNIENIDLLKQCKVQPKEFKDGYKIIEPKTRSDEPMTISLVGDNFLKQNTDKIIDALATLTRRLDAREMVKIRPSDLKSFNKKLSDFTLFFSDYCTEGEASEKLYEVSKKAWTVEEINKKTAKPQYKIETAQELTVVQKEIQVSSNMVKILSNFCGKVQRTEELFEEFILPLTSRLEELKLRSLLEECVLKLVQNTGFQRLNIRPQFATELASLHKLRTGLLRIAIDFNKIVDFLIDVQHQLSKLTANEFRFLAAHCTFWLSTEEMSVREKALEILKAYIEHTDLTSEHSLKIYKTIILSSIKYFLQSHFSREHVMKYFSMLVRAHSIKAKDLPEMEFSDLYQIIDEKDKDKDFFELIFNVKVSVRGQAIKQLKKRMEKRGAAFKSNTIKRVLAKIFDYYLYEYWQETISVKSAHAASRIDIVRQILNSVFDVYGRIVAMLEFPAYVRFVKDKIFQLDGKPEHFAETSIKIVCSCLNYLKSDRFPNILFRIQAEQRLKNKEYLQNSVINKFLEAYQDSSKVSNARYNFNLNLPQFRDKNAIQNELDELKQAPIQPQEVPMENELEEKEAEPVDEFHDLYSDDEEHEEKREKEELQMMTDNQYRTLKVHILAPLKKFLLKKDESEHSKSSVRSEVALGIINLIKLMPFSVFNTELIGLISKICSVLTDRDEDRRKSARNTLTNLLKILGPFFFGFFTKELAFHLKRGYEVHIRNYMIYKLIESMIVPTTGGAGGIVGALANSSSETGTIECGEIDYTVPIVSPLLADEISGDLEEEKEVQEIKNKMLEFRKNKALESFKLLAQKIDFKSDALKQMVETFRDSFLKGQSLSKLLGKMNELGSFIVNGLMVNPTLTTESIALFVNEMNKKALDIIRLKKQEVDDVSIRPLTLFEEPKTVQEKLADQFLIQEGAGQGESICKHSNNASSQDQV